MKYSTPIARSNLFPALLALALWGAGAQSAGHVLAGPDATAAHWNFDSKGNVATNAAEPGRFDGAIRNSENIQRVERKSGRALEFGAGQSGAFGCVTVEGMSEFNVSKGFTLEAWIRMSPQHARPDTCYIASDGAERGPGWRFIISYERLYIQSGDGQTTWGTSSELGQHSGFEVGRWYHVAATYDGSVYRLYLDGIEVGESEPDQKLTQGSGVLSIGSYGGGSQHVFKGAIDEVKLVSRAKSALEIIKAARLD